mmetsp:Transcript_9140/g.26109  ORF Transcript_9140/g.26109 Transcript_9140/m.26109 type:complete len:304 (-) Transcript_9140:3-914(-)
MLPSRLRWFGGPGYCFCYCLWLSLSVEEENLDSFWEEVSGLGGVGWNGKSGAQLVGDGLSGGQGLRPKSEDSNHGETAVLELLQTLLLVLLVRVVEAERVVASLALSDAEVSGHVVGSFLLDDAQSAELEEGHEEEDLEEGESWDLAECLQRVGVAVGVDAGPLVAWEGSEESRGDESDDGDLGDASVDELGLAVPCEVAWDSVASLDALEPGADWDGGEAERVEANVSQHGAVKGGWGGGEWEGGGWAGVGPGISGRGGTSDLYGWGLLLASGLLFSQGEGHVHAESSGGRDEEGGDGELHG